MYIMIGLSGLFSFLPAFAQHPITTVDVLESDDLPFNHAIVISRREPQNILAAGFNNRMYLSADQGETWKNLTSVSRPANSNGTPLFLSDRKGKIFMLQLNGSERASGFDHIICRQSGDGGQTWSQGALAGQKPGMAIHAHQVTIHPRTDVIYLTWTQFDKYKSADTVHKSNILFAMSKDGDRWSEPVKINQLAGDCTNDDNTAIGAAPVVTMDGRIFIVWSRGGKIYLDRSYNKGETWLINDLPVDEQHGGWSMEIPGLPRCASVPLLSIDNSASQYHGSLYLAWSDQKNGKENTDIWFKRSANSGDFWTQAIRVSGDSQEKHQFMPAMAVDHTTGIIYIIYYDRSRYDDLHTDVRMSFSTDGGATFKNITIDEKILIPSSAVSDNYIKIDAYRGIAVPVWTRMEGGKAVLCTTVIKNEDLQKSK